METLSAEQVPPKAAQCLPEGPACTKPLEEETLRQQVKKTLLDGAASGCLLSALAKLPPNKPHQVREERTLQQEVKHTLLDGFASGRLLSALAHLEQPRNVPKGHDSEICARTSSTTTGAESGACSEKPAFPHKDSRATDALTKSKSQPEVTDFEQLDALTKSKSQPEVTDFEQLDLQAKTALLDASLHVHAKETSPTKGKMVASPKRGGS